ncbi:MAG: NUDIX domain-containing protein [bacterium]
MIEFGKKIDGVTYKNRPCSYGVAIRGGKILIEIASNGWFLPGGGINKGETEEAGLIREFMEETGYEITKSKKIGEASEYVQIKGEYVMKVCSFFHVELGKQVSPTHPDGDTHTAQWVPINDAIQKVEREGYRWAIQQVVK